MEGKARKRRNREENIKAESLVAWSPPVMSSTREL